MQTITVTAPARLHLGFVGLYGQSASEYGALGLAIDQPQVQVRATRSSSWRITGALPDRVEQHVDTLAAELKFTRPLTLEVIQTIPAHIGLGSGTQLALAVAVACTRMNGVSPSIEQLSHLLRRGERSGIGTAAFHSGGFLVDCEARHASESRSLRFRYDFPCDWRILLVFDTRQQGVHGELESEAFGKLGGFSPELTQDLHGILRQQVIPGLGHSDLSVFGEGITDIQKRVGDFFSPIQGGRYLSPAVADVLEQAQLQGATGVGQSSWGPTGFVIVKDDRQARDLRGRLESDCASGKVRFEICRARNCGAEIRIE